MRSPVNMRALRNSLLALSTLAFCSMFFQNCSRTSFGSTSATSSNGDLSSSDPSAPVPASDIPAITCTSFQILAADANGVYQVPARDGSGVCYGVKVMDMLQGGASSLSNNFDLLTVANNQGIPGETGANGNPYMMEHTNTVLNFAGARRISLSGALDQVTSIQVDNFLMVGFGPRSSDLVASSYAAYGTADATLAGTNYVEFNNAPVALTAFASGGTASIGNVDISQTISAGEDYQLDLRADDCGGVRDLSDIYLIFQ